MPSRRPTWEQALLALSATLVLLGLLVVVQRAPQLLTTYATGPAVPVRTMVVLGDSYADGAGADRPGGAYPALTARALGYTVTVDAEGGTGYVRGASPAHPQARPLPQRLAGVVARAPGLVVVAAGLDDADRSDEATLEQAVRRTLTELRTGLPTAQVVVVGPFSPTGAPGPGLRLVDQVERRVADEQGLAYVSPIAERWVTGDRADGTGNAPRYVAEDGVHPSPAGHEHLARLLAADLRRLDVL